ncbi:M14 family zinc carboxypeptidase [Mucisphaera calidilacus]|uniref:Zinc carboxypeptidase n=1 Tax=Mucisphaera calidilacus TaxID=2527982 RepID=A0A518BUD6_9BACT|nr:M14 family zinc carboxypeptidase [Mucisphaera calidilacus]QDU70561.1 Zinc carboxypeptidase [Mucisphaera calidilacus]
MRKPTPNERRSPITAILITLMLLLAPARAQDLPPWITADLNITRFTTLDDENRILAKLPQSPRITAVDLGTSVQGRPLRAIRFLRTGKDLEAKPWTVLLIGAQHGNEHAGREALLTLITDLANNPDRIPPDTDLWIVPTANPDGTHADQRRNANNFDLNRDHVILSQPETRALHRLARTIEPDVTIDCHEFGRDSSDYTTQGWTEWPLVMMDTTNTPLLPQPIYKNGLEQVERLRKPMRDLGINYTRYMVGDAPPAGERRFSTLDIDDARNGLAMHAGYGFIIESGVYRNHPRPQHNLGERARAHKALVWSLISLDTAERQQLRADHQRRATPRFIPVNFFWAQHLDTKRSPQSDRIAVVDARTGRTLSYDAPNTQTERVVKLSVFRPDAYVIPAKHADTYRQLLDHHDIAHEPYDPKQLRNRSLEVTRLRSVSDNYDPTYHRYAGMQHVETLQDPPAELGLDQPGAIWIDASHDNRAIGILEPHMAFGLYQWPHYRATVGDNGIIPVYRVMPPLTPATTQAPASPQPE